MVPETIGIGPRALRATADDGPRDTPPSLVGREEVAREDSAGVVGGELDGSDAAVSVAPRADFGRDVGTGRRNAAERFG